MNKSPADPKTLWHHRRYVIAGAGGEALPLWRICLPLAHLLGFIALRATNPYVGVVAAVLIAVLVAAWRSEIRWARHQAHRAVLARIAHLEHDVLSMPVVHDPDEMCAMCVEKEPTP